MTIISSDNFKKFRNCPFCHEKMTLVEREEHENDSHKFSSKFYLCDKHTYNDKNYKVIFKSEKPWLFILESFEDDGSFLEFRGVVFKFKRDIKDNKKDPIQHTKFLLNKESEDMLIFLHKVGAQLAIQKELEFFNPSEMTFEQVIDKVDYLYLYDF